MLIGRGNMDKNPGETKQRQELSSTHFICVLLGSTRVFMCTVCVYLEIRTLLMVFLILVIVLLRVLHFGQN